MKKHFYLLLIISAIIININTSLAGDKSPGSKILGTQIPSAEYMLNNSNLGTEFWVAIPQNEVSTVALKTICLEIVVAPIKNTNITISIPELGLVKTLPAEAFKTTSFSSKKGDIGWNMQITDGEVVAAKGIHLTASEPFCAYVLNVKENSADGYMAIPVSQWDKEYFHCGYYDFYEASGWGVMEPGKRGGGFIILASEDGTNITITLNGLTKGVSKTVGGHDIGDTWSVSLSAGQTYLVRGKGETKGLYDITGTKIKANKPIGVISTHVRTMIPSICPEDRDHISEMIPPTSTLGKEYVSVQFNRKSVSPRTGKGDLFRVVAIQDNTKITCAYYDSSTGKLVGNQDTPLAKAGMFADVLPILDINDANTKKSIYGVAHWQSDKPFLLVQYAFSNRWDGDNKWAPKSIVVPPMEQYTKNAVFQVPVESDFNDNTLTIFAKGDPNDPEFTLLKSVAVDGNEIHKLDSKLFANRITGTDIYWTRLSVSDGAHYVTSNTLVSGYVTGFSSQNVYGYPMNINFNRLDVEDLNPPKLTKIRNCGNAIVEAVEPNAETGLSKIFLMDSLSSNFAFSMENPAAFKPQLHISKQKYDLNIIDNTKPATAVVAVMDRAGNFIYDTTIYEPQNIFFDKAGVDFGNIGVRKSNQVGIKMQNFNTDSMLITKAYIKGSLFKFTGVTAPFKLAPNEDKTFNITYTPTRQSVGKTDVDTLIVETTCVSYKFVLKGAGIIPIVGVQDWDFKSLLVGTKKCIEEMSVEGLKIDNKGSEVMTVLGVEGIKTPFILEPPTTPTIPFTINPGESTYLKSLCFIPNDSIDYSIDFTIKTDAYEGDSIVNFKGKGTIKEDPKSVEELITKPFDLKVVPNPVSDNKITLVYSNNTNSNLKIEIYDVKGHFMGKFIEEFTSEGIHEKDISIGSYGSGVYSIRMTSGSNVVTERLVITK